MTAFRYILAFLAGYLFGNISFSSIIAKKAANKDISKIGSGNPGATNVLRTLGLKYAVMTFAGDMLKAMAGAILGCVIIGSGLNDFSLLRGFYCSEIFVGGIGAILGHNFPVFMKFKGGKGVSCTLGLLTVMNPILGICFITFAALSNIKIKIYSIVSIITMLLASICYTVLDSCPDPGANTVQIIVLWALFALMVFMHRENIVRIFNGTEKEIKIFKSEEK